MFLTVCEICKFWDELCIDEWHNDGACRYWKERTKSDVYVVTEGTDYCSFGVNRGIVWLEDEPDD